MGTWSQFIANAYSDIGNTYQQILMKDSGLHYRPDVTRALTEQPQEINPEYEDAHRAYIEQEGERERIDNISVADYQQTNIDWQQYGRYTDTPKPYSPDLERAQISGPEPMTRETAQGNWKTESEIEAQRVERAATIEQGNLGYLGYGSRNIEIEPER